MIRQVWQLFMVQLKEFYRQPSILFWTFIFPISIAAALGLAFANKSQIRKKIAVIDATGSLDRKDFLKNFIEDRDNSEKSIAELKQLQAGFTFVFIKESELSTMMKRGIVNMAIRYQKKQLVFSFDPANDEARLSYAILAGLIARYDKSIHLVTSEIQPETSPGNRYIDFLIPGLLALGIMNSSLWGTGYNLIDLRIKKLLRRMVASPMQRSSFVLSHLLTRLTFVMVEMLVIILFARYSFDVRISGSIPALILLLFSGIIAFTGISVLIASRADNSRVGNGLVNAITMPMMILSGVFFSYNNFPDFIVSIIQKLPLTILADSIRSVFLEAFQLQDVLLQALALIGFGLLSLFVGLRIYKWY